MADNQTPEHIGLGDFLELTGNSLAQAQNSLLSGLNISSTMVLNNADLEVKVTVESDRGQVRVRPVSSEDIRLGSIDPGLLSTLKISYVSTIEEPIAETTGTQNKPQKVPERLVEEVLNRKDIIKLRESRGELQVKPTFVAEKNKWLVSVEDEKGTTLRDIVLPDA